MEAHPKSSPGDFYVENHCCTLCGVPQMLAPALIGISEEEYGHCYWKKQPETEAELEQALLVLEQQELGCHRYRGEDPRIQARVSPFYCDSRSPRASPLHQVLVATWGAPRTFAGEREAGEGLLRRLWRLLRRS